MCGRYLLYDNSNQKIKAYIDQVKQQYEKTLWETASFNEVFPSQKALVCVYDDETQALRVVIKKWGIPHFYQKKLIINARSETVSQKYTFKEDYQKRRCVVIASGYFEWNKQSKQKYYFKRHHEVLYMAAIYSTNPEIDEFMILTQPAHDECALIHDRTPLIFNEAEAIQYCKECPTELISDQPLDLEIEAIQNTLF